MATLTLKQKAEVIKEWDLDSLPDRIEIGSEEANDIYIEDKKISISHLIIERREGGYYIEDNRSAFGTFVNRVRITKETRLSSGALGFSVGVHSLVR